MKSVLMLSAIVMLSAVSQAQETARDFITMDVCLDSNNKIIMGMSPLDPKCVKKRDLLPTDKKIPYVMRRVQGLTRKVCKKDGAIKSIQYIGYRTGSSKTNVPVVRTDASGKNHERIISIVDQGQQESCGRIYEQFVCPPDEPGCTKACKDPGLKMNQQGDFSYKPKGDGFEYFDQTTFKNKEIMYWVDKGAKIKVPMDGYDILAVSDNFAYIAGTMDGNGGSYWFGPYCKDAPRSFERFTDSWALFPTKIPAKGTKGQRVEGHTGGGGSPLIGTSVAKKYITDAAAGTVDIAGLSCPGSDTKGALTTWERKDVVYTNGAKMDTIIASHFSNSAAKADQVERFYMTKQFGKTRWEAWKSADYKYAVSPTAQNAAKTNPGAECDSESEVRQVSLESLAMMKSKQCNVAAPGAVLTAEGVTMTIEGRKWFMTACADYTDIHGFPQGTPALLNDIPGLNEFFNGAAAVAAQPVATEPALAPAGNFKHGNKYYYSNGINAYCAFYSEEHFIDRGGNPGSTPARATMPKMADHGACGDSPIQAVGNFIPYDWGTILYSNGVNAYCNYANFDHYILNGGSPDTSRQNLKRRLGLPSGMQNHGQCGTDLSGLRWSYNGPISGMNCNQWKETSDPHTWQDNYLCWPKNRNLNLRFNSAGPIAGLYCTQIAESSDPQGTWMDNYLCSSYDMGLRFSSAGPIPGKQCIQINEPAEPQATTWNDNYLCF